VWIEKVVTGFLQEFRIAHVIDVAMLIQVVAANLDFDDTFHS
jgi:hypothetical protein